MHVLVPFWCVCVCSLKNALDLFIGMHHQVCAYDAHIISLYLDIFCERYSS